MLQFSSSTCAPEVPLLDKVRTPVVATDTAFSHVQPFDTVFRGDGLHNAPEKGTGWHLHEAPFHSLGDRQNSTSSSSMASGSCRAASVHSRRAGRARMAAQ